ncbi:FG-GAP repeat protein [Flagellimonas sp. HMM57]|uniref:hypothetical protein n=1 Tax=unclassified Flagellimonas TaxID=2644544 RepID=UPI0013D4B26F|nr:MULTISPECIES: hypothetical protein [unclassified Flagellimonas]UII77865.1 FG-GAP repeat protein [Flagellimonas sp. HMM57]
MKEYCLLHRLLLVFLSFGVLSSCLENSKERDGSFKDWKQVGNTITLEKSSISNSGKKNLFVSLSPLTIGVADFEKPIDTSYIPMVAKLFERDENKQWNTYIPKKEDTALIAQAGIFSMAKTKTRLVAGHLGYQELESTQIVTAESSGGKWTFTDTLGVASNAYRTLNEIKLSDDGNTMVVFPQLAYLTNASIQLFKRTENKWHPKGKPIIVKHLEPENHSGGNFLNYVALSPDGSKVAFGNPFDDINGTDSGSVKVFVFDASTKEWKQEGNTIYGDYPFQSFGLSMSFTPNKKGLLVESHSRSAKDEHALFEFNEGKWKRNIDYFKTEKNGVVGNIISIHENAQTLLSSDAEANDLYDYPKVIYLYERQDKGWKNIGKISGIHGMVLEHDFIPSENAIVILFDNYPNQKIGLYKPESH